MANDPKEETQKINLKKSKSSGDTQEIHSSSTQPLVVKKPKLWRVILFGILLSLLLGAAGGALGYQRGISDRLSYQNTEILSEAAEQFQYGLLQMNNGNYDLARSHFEYVLSIYPDFPGLTEKYTEVMVKLAQAGQTVPTQAVTPTVDNRGAEALFNQAQQEVQGRQWAAAINTLEALRNADYTYRTLEVDGLYFIALRHRAIEMILNEGNLEEGMYFLSVLGRYAPLDKESVNYYAVASLYLTGASYWELDWKLVVDYFQDLYAAMPGLYDGSMTASERYAIALVNYGDQLMNANEVCTAEEHYQTALNIGATIEGLQAKYNDAYLKCHPPTAEPTATEEIVVVETESPTPETTVSGEQGP